MGRWQASRFRRDRVWRRAGFEHAAPDSRVGQWRDFFSGAVNRGFKQRWGEAVVRLGYERSDDW